MERTITPGKAIWEPVLKDVPLLRQGRIRDVYDLGSNLLIVSTDRISAFDVVLPTPIPGKGKILNSLSAFWFSFLKGTVRSHLLSARVEEMGGVGREHRAELEGRCMLVEKAAVFPIECVARGYLMGSAWEEYQETQGVVAGIALPKGLQQAGKLPEVIFTPSIKRPGAQDQNIPYDYAVAKVVEKMGLSLEAARGYLAKIKKLSIEIFTRAFEHAFPRGIIIADTKLEFGLDARGEILLIDEALTPDCSRFWSREAWTPGKMQCSYDKQFIRDYLEATGWDKKPPAPELPKKVVEKTMEKYIEVFRKITGPAG